MMKTSPKLGEVETNNKTLRTVKEPKLKLRATGTWSNDFNMVLSFVDLLVINTWNKYIFRRFGIVHKCNKIQILIHNALDFAYTGFDYRPIRVILYLCYILTWHL